MPFYDLEVFANGDCYLCCPSWLPVVVGNIRSKGIKNVFNSRKAQRIRIAAYKGDFRYCKNDPCNQSNSAYARAIHTHQLARSTELSEKLKLDILKRRLILANGPSRLSENITEVCNIRCNFCRSGFRTEDGQVDKAFYEYLRDNANNIRVVSFCGGEPLINRRVKQTLQRFKNSSVLFYFTSNLNHLDEEMKELLRRVKIYAFHASLNAATRETYKKVCGSANWQGVLENLDFLINLRNNHERKFFVQISMVVTSENYKEIVEFAKLGVSKNVDRIIYYPMGEIPRNRHLQIGAKEIAETKHMLEDEIFVAEARRIEVEALKSYMESGL
jgi:pyruvate-formate lyase-activating enzyme